MKDDDGSLPNLITIIHQDHFLCMHIKKHNNMRILYLLFHLVGSARDSQYPGKEEAVSFCRDFWLLFYSFGMANDSL
ncbi:hypothetical protein O6P43_023436 [Quillaja saponaria]|uniref:Uncharacterized protein n=1 Tax=Quillaja saponaria TaxID=32244 RepID=A0AAD7LF67_QUISA|nr:hypothetical protein O6P43_023436 [Quillaja saponaria]